MCVTLYGIRFLTDFDFVSDDKDLYRLAWLKAAVPFHMIERSPGCLGCRLRPIRGGGGFCCKTMVQYAPDGSPLFSPQH
ncbi:hypothetical protein DYB25_004455 [Aphanomyces astaci]|uniref:Uncharacterized protein n=1 Tax=Aphanomyces astaci TaxID=112090 RepID=A0A397EHM3_APHAT|nr:hypothetical protein DYB25_004455 [Aphanomyces astaci]RHY23364.1 hypothetical protein DYB36_012198 [Aphanomyces astaci]RHY77240.1 hypothetical protein DYB38_014344 [Aphanomyces astaci]RHY79116.1 hypothetical protein DYB31_015300 [Aphanomyces astaci]RHZ32968.1 hypothetical protein DYB26_006741 [Aphanomyces astaci]